jgi:PilZ domain-containing protein
MLVGWQTRSDRAISAVSTLGLGGMFISTPEPPAVGETVKLLLGVPGGDVRATAMVRDSRPGTGMGVEFTAMGQEDRARLQQLLKRLIR